MFGALCGGVREEGWPDTRTGLIRELSGGIELAIPVFRGMLARGLPLDGGKILVESAGPCAGGETESPLQNEWDPIAMPLSGELFPLWVWLEEGLEVDGSMVEVEGDGWERGRGFTELCSDCTGLCRWERKNMGSHFLI